MTSPEKLIIDTPEQISIEFLLAGIGSRFLALALDTLVQVTLGLAMFLLALLVNWIVERGWPSAGPWEAAAVVLVWFLLYYGYFILFEVWWGGQTPGKRVVGLRVLSSSGRPATAHEVVIRNLVRIVDQFPAVYGVGILSALVSAQQQRLGDLAAGTVVVHERAAAAFGVGSENTAPRVSFGVRPTPEEFVVIEHFLERRLDLEAEVRVEAGYRIATRICARTALPVPTDSEAFLEALAADFRGRPGSGS